MTIAPVANLAELAADALRHLATQLDAAGSDPGPTTRRMLQLDRDSATGALVTFADVAPEHEAREARRQAAIIMHEWQAAPQPPADTLRRWARVWDAWALRVAA